MTTQGCPPPETLEWIAGLDPSDPRRAHLDGCARCRTHLLALRSFLAGDPVPPGADLSGARRILSKAIRDELQRDRERSQRRSAQAPRWSRFRWAAAWRPALGLAAAAVIVIALIQVTDSLREDHGIVLRGGSGTAAESGLGAAVGSDGAAEFRWDPTPGADAYQLLIYDGHLKEIARIDAGAGTHTVVPPDRLSRLVPAGTTVFWRVASVRGGDRVSLSPPATLRLP